jgi:16S rRNA (guanine(527)-N(7))-methyltransferase RsmG
VASDAFVAALRTRAPEFALELTDETIERFRRHYDLLVTWNRKLNLTRITDPDEAARRHFLESAYLTTLVDRPATFVDVGSGAGFPGLPLACMWPESEAILVEPLVKRAVFLKEVVRALDLPHVRVINRQFDPSQVPDGALVTSRALDGFRALLPLFLEAPAATVALFTEPDLLDYAESLAPERYAERHPLPGADRRYVGLLER